MGSSVVGGGGNATAMQLVEAMHKARMPMHDGSRCVLQSGHFAAMGTGLSKLGLSADYANALASELVERRAQKQDYRNLKFQLSRTKSRDANNPELRRAIECGRMQPAELAGMN